MMWPELQLEFSKNEISLLHFGNSGQNWKLNDNARISLIASFLPRPNSPPLIFP